MLPEHWRSMAHRLAKVRPAPIGSLCDETPEPIDGRYAPRKDEDGPDASAYITALRAENAALRARLGRDADGTRREAILRQQLAEVTADRDAVSAYNDRLRARIAGLELTVASLSGNVCGSQWIGSADTVPMPRVRSLPAPGGTDGR